jgi:phospholipid transport system substrate-binding protein
MEQSRTTAGRPTSTVIFRAKGQRRCGGVWLRAGVALLGLLVALLGPALTEASPTQDLRDSVEAIRTTFADPALADEVRQAAVRKIAMDAFHVPTAAAHALGTHWEQRTATELEEFLFFFGGLLERTYLMAVQQYLHAPVTYDREVIDGEWALVATTIHPERGTSIGVDYAMRRAGTRWLVHDVRVADLSLVGTFRAQFQRIIRDSSFAALVDRMRTQIVGRGE